MAIQALPGVGPVLAAVFVAEIGEVTRFAGPQQLTLLGGVDAEAPRVRHQGAPWPDHQAGQPRLVRWAAVEAVQRAKDGPRRRRSRPDWGHGAATNIAKVAAARKLLTLVYYGLRDGHIRALDREAPDSSPPRQRGRRGEHPRARPETRSKAF